MSEAPDRPYARCVLGVPLYESEDFLPEALESMLAQSAADLALVLVDDCSTDSTAAIARRYEALDPRVSFVRNEHRLGLTSNWRHTFRLAQELHPDAEYFAWGSDHDVWHPRWLEVLGRTLDRHPEAAMAYPDDAVIRAGRALEFRQPSVDTVGGRPRSSLIRLLARRMRAGQMVYGLFRTTAVERAGGFRSVLFADRLLLTEVALQGDIVRVDETLWYKRPTGAFSPARQRRACFPDGEPFHSRLPWWLVHASVLVWVLGVRGEGRPRIARVSALVLAFRYAIANAHMALTGRRRDLASRARRHAKRWRTFFDAIRADERPRRRLVADLARQARRHARSSRLSQRSMPSPVKRVEPGVRPSRASLLKNLRAPLAKAANANGPILVGPFTSEVGFELLYWIPLLRWAVHEFPSLRGRLVIVSRGGVAHWLEGLDATYVDILSLVSPDELVQGRQSLKQLETTSFDSAIMQEVQKKLGFEAARTIHPSVLFSFYYGMLKVDRFSFARAVELGDGGVTGLCAEFNALSRPAVGALAGTLPAEFIAARFYFRPSFPDTAANRSFAGETIRAIAQTTPVVLLNTSIEIDDHRDFVDDLDGAVIRIDHLMRPDNNLHIQTTTLSRAKAFVGTYGGLAYLPPFLGVPSLSFCSEPKHVHPWHFELARRVFDGPGFAPLVQMRPRDLPLTSLLAGKVQ